MLPIPIIHPQTINLEELKQQTVEIVSSKDNTPQKCLFFRPEEVSSPRPLLVALHTWSGGYEQGMDYLPAVKNRNWALVAPHFRGPNHNPAACASPLAIQDILDAVDYAKRKVSVDESRIYIVGASGGGHMSLMMAAVAPQLWAGVSAWVPVSDLVAWHGQEAPRRYGYEKQMEAVCGGAPSPQTMEEYRARSPLPHLAAVEGLPVDINAGIHDGHVGSVPISHSLLAFNALATINHFPEKVLTESEISTMTRDEKIPALLFSEQVSDPERKMAILFRREAGAARISIFEGGHEFEMIAALNWLSRQTKGEAADHSLAEKAPSFECESAIHRAAG